MCKYHPPAVPSEKDIPANATPIQDEVVAERHDSQLVIKAPKKDAKLEVSESEGDNA